MAAFYYIYATLIVFAVFGGIGDLIGYFFIR